MTAPSMSAARPASLGVDAVDGPRSTGARWLSGSSGSFKLSTGSKRRMPRIGHFRKIVAGKQLWNYDNLEPTEKKMC